MHRYKQLLLLFSLFLGLFFSKNAFGQGDYAYAVGLRAGNPLAISGKYFFADAHAVEAILGIQQPRGWGLTALYEYHGDFNWRGDANWFVGGGLSLMLNRTPDFSVGGDIIVGYEYTFPTLPINLALDWKPGYAYNPKKPSEYGLDLLQASLTLRYAFK
ncbi:MAG: hypothetical protein RI894_2482 [Bacteroidota bacterium]|jgi:hypothetical protein